MAWQATTALVVLLPLALLVQRTLDRRKRNPAGLPYPPGPPKAPFVGNMSQMAKAGYPLWEAYAEWAKEYGDMVYLTVPGSAVLVLNSLPVIRDLLDRRSSNYSDRPIVPSVEMTKADWNFGLLPYGLWWRSHRRSFHQLLNQNAISQYRPIVEHHTTHFLRGLLNDPKDFLAQTQTHFGRIILHMAYGIHDEAYIKSLTLQAEVQIRGLALALVPGRFLVNAIPLLRHVPSWVPGTAWKKDLEHLADLAEEMTLRPFVDAKQRMKEGKLDEGQSLIGQLLNRLPPDDDPEYEAKALIARNIAAVAYIGGADTTVGSAWNFILALAMFPEVQRRAQEEIDTVLGPGRLPDFDDVAQLPYLQALLKESVRFWPVAPVAVPHATTEDDVYNGYFIPRGTIVTPNTWAVFRDPEIYPEPLEFRPDRFLKDGKINPAVLDPESCVFGYGRRVCPGRHFSQESLGLMAASLLAVFEVLPAKDEAGNSIPLQYKPNGNVIVKTDPFECRILPRSSTRVALLAEGRQDVDV